MDKNKVLLFIWKSWYRQTESISERTFKDLSNDMYYDTPTKAEN